MENKTVLHILKFTVLASYVNASTVACSNTDHVDSVSGKSASTCSDSENQPSTFSDDFSENTSPVIIETSNMGNNTDWWVNSGAYFYRKNGVASTVEGKLPDKDLFRVLYAKTNPVDTDNGYRPQNINRLVTRAKFKNFTQQVYFYIDQFNASDSPNRNQSNGVLFFNRYKDGDNLYYVGLRVDGQAIIKKKLDGKYYTLNSAQVYSGSYNRQAKTNLIPKKQWIGLKTIISDNSAGNVDITMYLDDSKHYPKWTKVLEFEDKGFEADKITDKGFAGIRSDFMDVRFKQYSAIEN